MPTRSSMVQGAPNWWSTRGLVIVLTPPILPDSARGQPSYPQPTLSVHRPIERGSPEDPAAQQQETQQRRGQVGGDQRPDLQQPLGTGRHRPEYGERAAGQREP